MLYVWNKENISSQNGESSKAKADFMTLFLETIKNESFWGLQINFESKTIIFI